MEIAWKKKKMMKRSGGEISEEGVVERDGGGNHFPGPGDAAEEILTADTDEILK